MVRSFERRGDRWMRALVAVLVAGCGARSPLQTEDEAAGGGGAPGTTASATTSSSGSGGGACSGPVVSTPADLVFNYRGLSGHDPALVRAGDRVIAGARFGPVTQNDSAVLGHAALDPFGAWPPATTSVSETALQAWGAPFLLWPSPDGTFAVSYIDWPACIHTFGSGLDPLQAYPEPTFFPASFVGGLGCFRDLQAVIGHPGQPHAVASNVQNPALGDGYLLETIETSPDGGILTYDVPACALWRLEADLELLAGDLVIATSNATPTLTCDNELGVASNVVVGRFGSGVAAWASPTVDDVVAVELLPRPGGAWLLYRESGASAFTSPAVVALALGEDLTPTSPPIEATGTGLARFAAAQLGDGGGLVVVSDELLAQGGSGPLVLRAFDADGALLAEAAIPTGVPPVAGERLAVITSPRGDSALVMWTAPSPSQGSQLVGARVDCL